MAIAFDGVTVVPMDSDRVVAAQTVVVQGNRISWVGPQHEARVPSGVQRIAGLGKYLLPGLADMHCHPTTEDDLTLLLAHGVTTIRNMSGMPRHLLWRDRIAAGELLGPTIHTTGPIVDGRPVRDNWNVSVTTRSEANAAVALTARDGYDALKVYDQLTPQAYGWLVRAAKDCRLPVDGHVPFRVGLRGVLDAGQRCIEHLYGYPAALRPNAVSPPSPPRNLAQMRSDLLEAARCAETARIPELAEATRAAGTWNCPTLIIRRRWLQDSAAILTRPERSYIAPARLDSWRHFVSSYPNREAAEAVCELNAALVRALSTAGAGLLIGTDAGIPHVVCGASIHEELEAFVAAGLSPYQALRAATGDAAVFLGEPGEWGQVAVGSRADLVLVEANPLTEMANAAQIAGVMANGRWLPGAELADRLAELAARRNSVMPRQLSGTDLPGPNATTVQRLRYRVHWAGHPVGEEQLAVESRASGGHRIFAVSSIETFGSGFGAEAGTYRAVVEVDEKGIDRFASFEYEGSDGRHRIEITRDDMGLRVRRAQGAAGESEEFVDTSDDALLAYPLVFLYVRLAERLNGLEFGDHLEVSVIGPGLAPDLTVQAAQVRAERLPATAKDEDARYAVEFKRPNATTPSLLSCDASRYPTQLELVSDLSYWLGNAPRSSAGAESAVRVIRC